MQPAENPTTDSAIAAYQRPLVAGWLSLIVHVVVLIVGVLLVRTVPRLAEEEPERPASIVLAAVSADKTDYFDESSESPATGETASSSVTDMDSGSALPAAGSAAAFSPDIALPSAAAPIESGLEIGEATTAGAATGTRVLDPNTGREEILAAEAKRPKGKGSVGPQGEVNLFGTGAMQGHSFVFVIDRSQSMGSEGLGAIAVAQAELRSALAKLESNHQFQVIAYNQSPTWMGDRKLLSVGPETRADCDKFLEELAAFGSTNHERALLSAMQARPDVIYLLTDGDPVLTAGQRARIREESGGRTKIVCIQFGRIRPLEEATRTALQALAREMGGSYVFVDMNKRE